MNKTIIITYNEADEGLIMPLFKRLKIKTQSTVPRLKPLDEEPVSSKEVSLNNLKESIEEVQGRHIRGGSKFQYIEDLIVELKQESVKIGK